jgi:hypothetical protein
MLEEGKGETNLLHVLQVDHYPLRIPVGDLLLLIHVPSVLVQQTEESKGQGARVDQHT